VLADGNSNPNGNGKLHYRRTGLPQNGTTAEQLGGDGTLAG